MHPLIYIRGVRFEDLVSILDFIYYGEVNIAQNELTAFLNLAEELQVKGLTHKKSTKETKRSINLISNNESKCYNGRWKWIKVDEIDGEHG